MKTGEIIKYPLSSEKSVRLMEAENKLLFVVDRHATRQQVKEAIEELFKVKVTGVNIMIDGSTKKAYVKLSSETPAIDIATQLGLV